MVALGLFACAGPPFAAEYEFPPQTCDVRDLPITSFDMVAQYHHGGTGPP